MKKIFKYLCAVLLTLFVMVFIHAIAVVNYAQMTFLGAFFTCVSIIVIVLITVIAICNLLSD